MLSGGLLIKAILIGGFFITAITGINVPLIILDLLLKLINIVSGNAFFKSIFSQAFEPTNPIFIIYISIFLISFVLSLLFIIKASLQSTMNYSEFRDKNHNKSMIHKWKWLGFWGIGFILVPSIFLLVNFVISQISGIFGNGFFGNALLTTEDWIYYKSLLDIEIFNFQSNILNWKNELNKLDPALGLDAKLVDALINELTDIDSRIDNIKHNLNLVLHKETGLFDMNSLKWVQDLFRVLEKNILTLSSKFYNNGIFSSLLDIRPNPENTYLDLFLTSSSEITNVIKGGFDNNEKSLTLSNFIIRGISGYPTNNYIPEPLTLQLSKLIYGVEIWELFPTYKYFDGFTNGLLGFLNFIFYGFLRIAGYVFNAKRLLSLLLGTFFTAVILSSFLGILLMLAKRIFEFVGLILISPVVLANGINDSGSKFELWFKTILGKQLLVLSVSFAISIFNLLIYPLVKASDAIFVNIGIFGPIHTIGASIALIVLKGLMLVASSMAMVEFIEWLNIVLNADSKITSVGKGFMKKTSNVIDSGAEDTVFTPRNYSKRSSRTGRLSRWSRK